jgi:septal ring factor EnvC (AmiA/AmiB activator)
MSTDRTAEMLNYLSAISREIGEMRTEMNARFAAVEVRFTEISTRLDRIERELRQHTKRLDRIEAMTLTGRADIEDLQDRIDALEEKRA